MMPLIVMIAIPTIILMFMSWDAAINNKDTKAKLLMFLSVCGLITVSLMGFL